MRKLTQYVGIGLLCVAGAIVSCKDQKEEPQVVERPPIVEIVENIETGEKFNIEYTRIGGKLRSSLNEFVEPYNNNCIIRYTGSSPGSMITCVYDQGKRISVQFTNSMGNTSTIDDSIDSKDVQEYRTRFEKDRSLLQEAGLLQ